jgi:hypothetical protein
MAASSSSTTSRIVHEVLSLTAVHPAAVRLANAALEALSSRNAVFAGIRRSALRSKETARRDYVAILREMFGDGIVNWGRIVMMFALAIDVQRHHHEIDLQIDTVLFIEDHLSDRWLRVLQDEEDGGWSAATMRDDSLASIAASVLFILGGLWTAAVLLRHSFGGDV